MVTRTVDKMSGTATERKVKAGKARASCKRFMDTRSAQLRTDFTDKDTGKLLWREYGQAVETAYIQFIASEVHYLNLFG